MSCVISFLNKTDHGWEYSGYSQISGFRFLSEGNQNGVEMHLECDVSPFRIQSLTQSHPWKMYG